MSRCPALLVLWLVALPLHAGDPVPDVDVTVEQVPGKGFTLEAPSGGAFDEVRMSLPRGVGKGVSPEGLPQGWTLSRDGKDLVLQGPEAAPPVRLWLTLGGDRPREVTYEVRRAGAVLLRRENVVPRTVPPRQIRNSLQGVVQLPGQVSPGETIAFGTLETAELPPGRFVLSGVVSEPVPETEWQSLFAIVNTTRSDIKTRMGAAVPAGGFELQSPRSSCGELAPLAAALAAAGRLGQGGVYSVARDSGGSTARKSGHDAAMSAIRNIKAFYAAAPAGGGDRIAVEERGRRISIKEEGVEVWNVTAPGEDAPVSITWEPAASGLLFDDSRVVPVVLRGEPTPEGCRFTPREPGWLEVVRAGRPASGGTIQPPPGNTLSGTVHAVELPEDLAPGVPLSLQYIDLYGDLWLDVPAVPGTDVVPPPSRGESPPACVRTATRYVQGEELVCVCGSFPSPESWSALLFGSQPAGTPVSASSSTVWLRLPRGAQPGRHVISGRRDAGFGPGCETETQLVHIRGELDSQSLLRGESTPMRLWVSGTADSVPLRVRNLTPSIISIDGGVDQMSETSGGPENVFTRQVRGLTRGNFNIDWTLATPPCPCAETPPAR